MGNTVNINKLRMGEALADRFIWQVSGRRWRDMNGNTYHVATIFLNGKPLAETPITYGYGSHYRWTGDEVIEALLADNALLDSMPGMTPSKKGQLRRAYRERGLDDLGAVDVPRKRDL